MTKPVLLVDGYNVIRLTPPYREIAQSDLDSARAALVSDVAAYAAGVWDATVVFDGGGNKHSTGEVHSTGGISVVFSHYGTDADSVVEMLASRARERGLAVEVVTSDAQTQWAVMGRGVARRSSGEFARELRADAGDWREHAEAGPGRTRIEDVLDESIRTKLANWARGDE